MGVWENMTAGKKISIMRNTIDEINQEYSKQNKHGDKGVKVTDDIEELFSKYKTLDANDRKGREQIEQLIAKKIADQMPKTMGERIRSWRYFAMLSNPATWSRNIIGNILQQGMQSSANMINTITEKALIKSSKVFHNNLNMYSTTDTRLYEHVRDEVLNKVTNDIDAAPKTDRKSYFTNLGYDSKMAKEMAKWKGSGNSFFTHDMQMTDRYIAYVASEAKGNGIDLDEHYKLTGNIDDAIHTGWTNAKEQSFNDNELIHVDNEGKVIKADTNTKDAIRTFYDLNRSQNFNSKYGYGMDTNGFKNMVKNEQNMFNGKYNPLTYLEKAEKFMLDTGDKVFIKHRYIIEMSRSLASQGYTAKADSNGNLILTDTKTGKQVGKAKADSIVSKYDAKAYQVALEDTYHDASEVADAINKLQRNKHIGLAVDAVMPFTKTPINIAKRAIEYSPAGLVKGINEMVNSVQEGKVDASTALNNFAKGATGTVAFGLGFLLSQAGVLNGHMTDGDDKKYLEANGYQDYSLNIDGKTVSLDWASPAITSMLMGAQVMQSITALTGENNTDSQLVNELVNSALSLCQPIMDTTFMSGLVDFAESFSSYPSTGASGFAGAMESAIKSYVSQFSPTLFKKINNTIDEYKRTTYSDNYFDSIGRNIVNSIPLMDEALTAIWGKQGVSDKYLQPSIDTQGENVKSGGAINNIFNPATVKDYNLSDEKKELTKLYEKTGDSILPHSTYSLKDKDGTNVKLNSADYTQYNKQILSGYNDQAKKFMNSSIYAALDDSDRSSLMSNLKTYYTNEARTDYFSKVGDPSEVLSSSVAKTVTAVDAAKEIGIEPYQYFYYKSIQQVKDSAGNNISNSAAMLVRQNMEASGTYDAAVKLYSDGKISSLSDIGLTNTVAKMTDADFAYTMNKLNNGELTASDSTAKTPEEQRNALTNGIESSQAKEDNAKTAGYSDINKYYKLMDITADKDADGNTLNYSKAMKARAQMIEDGTYDKAVELINNGDAEPADFNLNATVVKWTEKKFNTNYAKLQNGEWVNTSSSSSKSSSSSSGSSSSSKSSGSSSSKSSSSSSTSSALTETGGLTSEAKALFKKYVTSANSSISDIKSSLSDSEIQSLYNEIVSGHTSNISALKKKYDLK
jgi:hypothetical protein